MTRADDHNNGNCDGGAGILGCPMCRAEDDEPQVSCDCGHPDSEHFETNDGDELCNVCLRPCLYCTGGRVPVTVYAEDGSLRVDLARCPRCGGRG